MTDTNQPGSSPAPAEPTGFSGLFQDPSTLAATGLLLAVLFAIVAGLFSGLEEGTIQEHLLALTNTVDVGDVALLGIAGALLVVTPDPPGGIPRPLLLQAATLFAAIIAVFGVVRAVVVVSEAGTTFGRVSGFLATLGVALASATVAFWTAKESLVKEHDQDQAPA